MPSAARKQIQVALEQARELAGYGNDWQWTWTNADFWTVPADRVGAKHSPFYKDILAKHPATTRDKDPNVLIPFLRDIMERLGVPEMYVAVHCDHQRKAPKNKSQSYLGDIMAGLIRYRVPGHSDQGYKLYKAVASVWPSPAGLKSSKSLTVEDTKKNGSQGSAHEFTSEELDIIRMVITEWRKLVPPLSDTALRSWFSRRLLDNKGQDNSLPFDLLLGAIGYRLRWLFVNTSGDLASRDAYSKAVTQLRNSLSKSLSSGALLAEGDSPASGSSRSSRFANQAVDRAALLKAFRTSEDEPTWSDDQAKSALYLLATDAGEGKAERARRWQSLGDAWDPNMSKVMRQAFIDNVKAWVMAEMLGNMTVMRWGHDELCWLVKFLVEKGTKEVNAVAMLMRGRGYFPSIESIRSAAENHHQRVIQAARSLQISCPRWWRALNLGTPEEVAESCMNRGAPGSSLDDDRDIQPPEAVQALQDLDEHDACFLPEVLPTTEAAYTSWLLLDIPQATPSRVAEMISTKSAIVEKAVNAIFPLPTGDTEDEDEDDTESVGIAEAPAT